MNPTPRPTTKTKSFLHRTRVPIAFVAALFTLIMTANTAPGENHAAAEPREAFVPIIGESNMPEIKLDIPTGSEEFTVLPPAPTSQETVSVEKFGASPDNADNTKAFNEAIAYCATSHAGKLVVPKGVYHFTKEDSVLFSKLVDFEFDGQGSTFIYNHPRRHFMEIHHCERALFKNFSVDWDWDHDPLASIVEVENVEPSGAYADLRFVDYKRFPKRDIQLFGSLYPVDPATRSVGFAKTRGYGWGVYGTNPKVEWQSDNLLRLFASTTGSSPNLLCVKKGDLFLVAHRLRGDGGINLGNNVHLTLSHVNVYSCPSAAFYAWGDQHHVQLLHCNIKFPPGVKRACTSLSDHVDWCQSQGYFKMIGCEISYGQDDCFAVMGGGMLAEKTGENTVKVGGLLNRNGLDVGDPIEFRQDDYSPAGFTGKITKIKLVDESEGICEFSFAEKVPDPQGKLLVLINRRYSPKNIIIRNCSFHDNYARGLYLKGDSITVENNRFFHNSEGAMEVVSYYVQPPQGIDGAGASNIVIRNNVIDTSGPSFNNFGSGTSFIPAIYLISNIQRTPQEPRMGPDSRTRYPILKDILIEGNKFINFPGAVVSVFSSGNVIIRNNKINATKSVNNDPPYRGSIEVGFSSGAFVLGNKWTSSPYMKNPGLFIDKKTTEDVFWKDNVMKDRTSHGKTP